MPTNDTRKPVDVLAVLMAHARHVAHDIGNPLSGLSLSLEMLGQTDMSPSQARYVERSRHACEKLFALQSHLSSLAGGGRETSHAHDIASLCAASAASLGRHVQSQPAPSEGRVICLSLGPGAEQLFGVKELLTAAFYVLLTNADEASPRGPIDIKSEHKQGGVQVQFSDRGPGVPAHVAPCLFVERCTSKPRGVGLGLLRLALIVTRQHAGRVQYEGHKDGRTRFSLWLPNATAP